MPYSSPTEETLQIIHTELEYQFGFGIDAVHMSNRALHAEATKFTSSEQHIYLPDDDVIKTVNNLPSRNQNSIPVFHALSTEGKNQLYAQVLKTISSF